MPIRNKMKTLAILAVVSLATVACGKTKRAGNGDSTAATNAGSTSVIAPITIIPVPTPTATAVPVSGTPALTYDFQLRGDQTYTTPLITTDTTLKVKFLVGTYIGNIYWQSQQLKVTVAVNGQEIIPTYSGSGCPSGGCTYGLRSDGASNVMDFTYALTPGLQTVTITVKNPMYDYYCTFPAQYGNTQFGQYPGCYKNVFVNPTTPANSHQWSGRVIVQTSSTVAI